jgi:hypothetical protein
MAHLTFTNVQTGAALTHGTFTGSTNAVLSLRIERDADGAETISWETAANADIGAALFAACTPGSVAPIRFDLRLSHDSSGHVAARGMVEHPTFTIDAAPHGPGSTIAHSGEGLFRGYALTLTDHLTTHHVQVGHLLTAPPATPPAAGLGNDMAGGIGQSELLARLKGYLQTTPGFTFWTAQTSLRATAVVDGSISTLLVDSDEDSAPINESVLAAIGAAAGIDTGSTVGLRAHWVADSSDSAAGNMVPGVDGTNYGVGISVGQTPSLSGPAPGVAVHFTDRASTSAPGDVQVVGPIGLEFATEDAEAQVTMIGGTNAGHGLPQGATITGLCTVANRSTPDGSWDSSLLVIGCKTATGDGGVYYYHPESRTAWPCSPSLPVNWLWYDNGDGATTGNACYIGTPRGVYRQQNFADRGPGHYAPGVNGWAHLGGSASSVPARTAASADCAKVLAETTPTDTYVTALFAQPSQQALTGVYIHPAIDTGSRAGKAAIGGGFDGWTALVSVPALFDYSYDAVSDALYYVTHNNPASIFARAPIHTTTPQAAAQAATPDGSAITGLDWIPGGVVVRTAAGSVTLLYARSVATIDSAHALVLASMGTAGLVDASGAPVMINRIIAYAGNPNIPAGSTIGTLAVTFLACTDSGIYYTTDPIGSCTWHAVGAQSGISDQNILHVAAGTPQYLISVDVDHSTVSRVFCSTGNQLYVSHSDALFFDDEWADPVDLGLYWLQLAVDATDASNIFTGGGPKVFPKHDIVGYAWPGWPAPGTGNVSGDPGYVGTPGIVRNTVSSLPAGFSWVSPIDERGKRSYRLTNLHADAPYAATHAGEISQIVASAGVTLETASGRLAAVHLKQLKEGSTIQVLLTLASYFSDPAHVLAGLRPMQQVTVTLSQPVFGPVYSAEPFYVLRHVIEQQRGEPFYRTTTTLARLLRDRPATDAELGASVGAKLGKSRRFMRIWKG